MSLLLASFFTAVAALALVAAVWYYTRRVDG